MEKIILRKDYKTRVVPVEESIGHYLAKAARTWTEDFIDEDTKETVTIDRCEVLLERGKLITYELAKYVFDVIVDNTNTAPQRCCDDFVDMLKCFTFSDKEK